MESAAPARSSTFAQRAAAWAVHGLTASGAAMGLFALLAADRGDLETSAFWMLAAFAVDAIDGTLARAAQVRTHAPRIDGRRLDDVVDYLNYVIVPCFFLAANGYVGWGWAALPALASAYQFAQADAKTDDHFFLGFPSYWNFYALYAWLFDAAPATSAVWLAALSVLVFVPVKYLYPTRMVRFGKTMVLGAVLFTMLLAFASWVRDPFLRARLAALSLLYPAAYLALSLWLGGLRRARGSH